MMLAARLHSLLHMVGMLWCDRQMRAALNVRCNDGVDVQQEIVPVLKIDQIHRKTKDVGALWNNL